MYHYTRNLDPYPITSCRVELKNQDLWTKFHECETEMIITKTGRRMFPSLQVAMKDMDPQSYYCVFLEMTPASRSRYKYSAGVGWSPAGTEDVQHSNRIYVHPESPALGEQWMMQPVSFGRVKLTNAPNPPIGHIVLTSMHKYQPRIIIAKTNDPRSLPWTPSFSVTFPETVFIAVTAYQNERITRLKIDHNPFAKGFRENGQSKCKKRKIEEEVIDIISNEEESTSHVCSSHQVCSSPPPPRRSESSSPSSTSSASSPSKFTKREFEPIILPYHNLPYTFYPNHYYYPFPLTYPIPCHYPIERREPTTKKLTDFSIEAITGMK